MAMKAVEINLLNFTYPDGYQALKDVSFQVLEGESVAIIGPNGAGKSTLLLHLNGLLGLNAPVKIFSRQINKENLKFIRQKIGFVFQDPQDQLFMPTVYEDVCFGPENMGLSSEEIKEAAKRALKLVDLYEKKDFLSHHLSLGEQKRASIATVMSLSAEILVLDEPNSNLDPASRRHLINFLKELRVTKIIATHDLEMVIDLCKRVTLLNKGKIIADGETKKILSDKSLLEACGLEVPYSLL